MASSWVKGLHPQLAPWFEALYAQAVIWDRAAVITSAKRTTSDQARLYRRFLAGQSKFPAAPPGRSYHEFGRAIDMVARPEVLNALGKLWASWGGTWGGVKDPIHFQA